MVEASQHFRLSQILFAGFWVLPQALPILSLAGLLGALQQLVPIQPIANEGKHGMVSLEPYLVPTLEEDDDEPEEEHGKSKFERPVKGRIPLQRKKPTAPIENLKNKS
jgi:hypothetical protein